MSPVSTVGTAGLQHERDLWSIAAGRWKLMVAFTMVGVLVGFVLTIVLPREYRVQTTLLIVSPDTPTASQTGVARSLASIVGGVGFAQNNVREEALALLESDRLAWDFLTTNNAVGLVTPEKDLTDDDIRGNAIEKFQNKILSVSDDRRTGLITLSILWRDRQQAAQWANDYIRLADDTLRKQTLKDSERTLQLLEHELEGTNVIDLREAINRSYETQLQRMLFARARDSYALRTIDPAMAPAEANIAAPNRKLILASSFVLGALAGLIAAVMLETSQLLRLRASARRASSTA